MVSPTSDGENPDFDHDLETRKSRGASLRLEALKLDEEAEKLRAQALTLEQKAAKMRIESWKVDGSISAVTKAINIEDKYERELAELDILMEQYIDDKEKFEWFQTQRKMIVGLLGYQKQQEAKTKEELSELLSTLRESQEYLGVQFVDDNGNILAAGWGVIIIVTAIPLWLGSLLFSNIGTLFATPKDPFVGL